MTDTGHWQPIETAPKDGENELLWDGDRITLGWFWSEQAWRNGIEACFFQPTHWMPLPEPPKETL